VVLERGGGTVLLREGHLCHFIKDRDVIKILYGGAGRGYGGGGRICLNIGLTKWAYINKYEI